MRDEGASLQTHALAAREQDRDGRSLVDVRASALSQGSEGRAVERYGREGTGPRRAGAAPGAAPTATEAAVDDDDTRVWSKQSVAGGAQLWSGAAGPRPALGPREQVPSTRAAATASAQLSSTQAQKDRDTSDALGKVLHSRDPSQQGA